MSGPRFYAAEAGNIPKEMCVPRKRDKWKKKTKELWENDEVRHIAKGVGVAVAGAAFTAALSSSAGKHTGFSTGNSTTFSQRDAVSGGDTPRFLASTAQHFTPFATSSASSSAGSAAVPLSSSSWSGAAAADGSVPMMQSAVVGALSNLWANRQAFGSSRIC